MPEADEAESRDRLGTLESGTCGGLASKSCDWTTYRGAVGTLALEASGSWTLAWGHVCGGLEAEGFGVWNVTRRRLPRFGRQDVRLVKWLLGQESGRNRVEGMAEWNDSWSLA